MSKSPSMFDKNKLAWVNNRYIKMMSLDEVSALCIPFIKKAYDCTGLSDEHLKQLVALFREQLSYGQEIVELVRCFFEKPQLDEAGVEVMNLGNDTNGTE